MAVLVQYNLDYSTLDYSTTSIIARFLSAQISSLIFSSQIKKINRTVGKIETTISKQVKTAVCNQIKRNQFCVCAQDSATLEYMHAAYVSTCKIRNIEKFRAKSGTPIIARPRL